MQNTGLMRRLAAIMYDMLLLFAILMLVGTPFVIVRGGEAVPPMTDLFFRVTIGATIYLYFVVYWTRSGRTLGMQSWGLQLETPEGTRPTIAPASLRFFAAILSWAPVGLGFLWQLWDKDKLTWHDRISGTRLVHYPKPGK
jgi:uncharacterized RDD family membrane protein YckC